MAEVRITDGFETDLATVESKRVLNGILNVVKDLSIIPSMGSTDVPASIDHAFGEGARKIPIGPFDIVTIYYAESDVVEVLGLVHQRAAW